MKAVIYNRISSENQGVLPLQLITRNKQEVEIVNENGFSFLVCHRCGGTWGANTLSKWVISPTGELRERKRYPRPKCPECD